MGCRYKTYQYLRSIVDWVTGIVPRPVKPINRVTQMGTETLRNAICRYIWTLNNQ